MSDTTTNIPMRCSKCHRVTNNLTYINSTYPEEGLCPECYDKVKPVTTIYNPSYENWETLKTKIQHEINRINLKRKKNHYITDAELSVLFVYNNIVKTMEKLESAK